MVKAICSFVYVAGTVHVRIEYAGISSILKQNDCIGMRPEPRFYRLLQELKGLGVMVFYEGTLQDGGQIKVFSFF